MNDREKLIALFESFDVSVKQAKSSKSLIAARRRFYFDERGRIEKILDYDTIDRPAPSEFYLGS